jgi:hypothetical protein
MENVRKIIPLDTSNCFDRLRLWLQQMYELGAMRRNFLGDRNEYRRFAQEPSLQAPLERSCAMLLSSSLSLVTTRRASVPYLWATNPLTWVPPDVTLATAQAFNL